MSSIETDSKNLVAPPAKRGRKPKQPAEEPKPKEEGPKSRAKEARAPKEPKPKKILSERQKEALQMGRKKMLEKLEKKI
jgi:hypothetical protein